MKQLIKIPKRQPFKWLLRPIKRGNADDMHLKYYIYRQLSYLTQTEISKSHLINSKIKNLFRHGKYTEALKLYSKNLHSPIAVTRFTFPSLLKICAVLPNLYYGKTIHSTIITMGLQFDSFITTSLINMYVKCGCLENAVLVFGRLSDSEVLAKDVSIWNSMIDGYSRFGHVEKGLKQFCQMQSFGVRPDGYSLSIILNMCDNEVLGLSEGKQIHGYIIRNMFDGDPYLDTAIIDMYLSWGNSIYARCVFDSFGDRSSSVAMWNVMIRGMCDNGLWECSLELYSLAKNEDVELGSTSFSSVLGASGTGEDWRSGMQIHCDVIRMGLERDPYVCTSLLIMYGKCRLIENAETVFNVNADAEAELWNAMISAYVNNGCPYEALQVYNHLRLKEITSDICTVSNILSSSSMIGSYEFSRSIHAELIKRPIHRNMKLQNQLLSMYAKCGQIGEANLVFSTMEERDDVAFGSMIWAFCHNNKFYEAVEVFRSMDVKPDSDIMVCLISACSGLENVKTGEQVHGFIAKSGFHLDPFVANSLIDMYFKCGFPDSAEHMFSSMQQKNLVAWNSMMSCYCRNGLSEKAIELFPRILQHGLCPDPVTITIVVNAVSSVAALLQGKTIHGYLTRLQLPCDIKVENALIDMYIKCGLLKYAEHIFLKMSRRDLVTWNSMIGGYGSHGKCHKSLTLYEEMKSLGIKPDEVTFLSLISSCNHSGLVEIGQNLFGSMKSKCGVKPKTEHYANMVDLLGRAGRMDEAYEFIKNMPIEPERSVWLSLLCACRAHHNVELGEMAAQKLLELEPERAGNYGQLLHLYGEAELWDRAANLRLLMKQRGVKKNPGRSWIEVRNMVDVFFSGDSSSPRTAEIHAVLKSLRRNMEKKGGNCERFEVF